VTALTLVSTGTNPGGWRAWWREQSRLDGSDWRSLLTQHREVFQCLCEHVEVQLMVCPVCNCDPCLGPTFCAACRKADAARKPKGDAILRLTRLMDPAVTFEQAKREISGKNRAAASTVEALMFELRGGTKALSEPVVRRRLAELSEQQLRDVGARLQRLKPEIANAWSAAEIPNLISVWTEFQNERR
jgi:hypothetical protein